MSTTTAAVDGLSAMFSQNVGSDNTVVLGPTSVTISDIDTGGADIRFAFSTPFFYNPSSGNLLLDIFNYSGSTSSLFNGVAHMDTTSSLLTLNSVNDPSGILSTAGLVTVFEVTPVPEPYSFLLLLAGLGSCLWGRALALLSFCKSVRDGRVKVHW